MLFRSVPITNTGCGPIYVLDKQTGEMREATTEEVKEIVESVGDVARLGVVAIGRPEWLVFVDVGVRIAALVAGFVLGSKKAAAKAAIAAGSSAPT